VSCVCAQAAPLAFICVSFFVRARLPMALPAPPHPREFACLVAISCFWDWVMVCPSPLTQSVSAVEGLCHNKTNRAYG
jgi:hypothetical protein